MARKQPNPRMDTGASLLLRWPPYTKDLKQRLVERAETEGRILSNLIYYALDQYLREKERSK